MVHEIIRFPPPPLGVSVFFSLLLICLRSRFGIRFIDTGASTSVSRNRAGQYLNRLTATAESYSYVLLFSDFLHLKMGRVTHFHRSELSSDHRALHRSLFLRRFCFVFHFYTSHYSKISSVIIVCIKAMLKHAWSPSKLFSHCFHNIRSK